jgi:hypothetical protein
MKIDLRKPAHKKLVADLYKQVQQERLKSLAVVFQKLWQKDQDLKDIELLSLYEETNDYGA